MRWQREGMYASEKGAESLAMYQEARIRHLHATLDKYLQSNQDSRPDIIQLPEYTVQSIIDTVRWLGFDWAQIGQARGSAEPYQASDYFDFMYRAAEGLIEASAHDIIAEGAEMAGSRFRRQPRLVDDFEYSVEVAEPRAIV